MDVDLIQALARGLTGPAAKGVIVRSDGQGRFRYRWDKTVVQGMLLPKPGGKVSVAVTQSNLADAEAVERQRTRWRTALNALAAFLDERPGRTVRR